jgi:hypothetical protein
MESIKFFIRNYMAVFFAGNGQNHGKLNKIRCLDLNMRCPEQQAAMTTTQQRAWVEFQAINF